MPDYDMVPTVELFVELPTFSRRFGGYQPEAVDEALTEISKQLDAERERVFLAQQRLMEAEAVLETVKGPATFDHLAAAANKILADAGRAATEIMREAELRVRELLLRVDADAAEIIAEAERRAGEPKAEAEELRAAVERRRAEVAAEAEREVAPVRAAAEAEAALVRQEAFEAVELLMGDLLARRDAVALDVAELEEQVRRTIERTERSREELALTAARLRHRATPPDEHAATDEAGDLLEAFGRPDRDERDRPLPEPIAAPATAEQATPPPPTADQDPTGPDTAGQDAAGPAPSAASLASTAVLPVQKAPAEPAEPAAAATETAATESAATEAGATEAGGTQAGGTQATSNGQRAADGAEGAEGADPWAAPSQAAAARQGQAKRRVKPSGGPRQGRAGPRA